MLMFRKFAGMGAPLSTALALPKGVHCLGCRTKTGETYYVVNSTASEVKMPVSGMVRRQSLFAPTVLAVSIKKYGSYGDEPGDIDEIVPRDFADAVLPPYSVSLVSISR